MKREKRRRETMRGTGKGTIDFVNARVILGGLRNGAARGEGEAKHYGPSPFLLRLREREGERKKKRRGRN